MINHKHIDDFYSKIESLSEDLIQEAMSFFGAEILDHSEATKYSNKLGPKLAFSHPWVAKILSNQELKDAYLPYIESKNEEIDEIGLAEELLRHNLLSKFVLSNRFRDIILGNPYYSTEKDLWVDFFSIDEAIEAISGLSSSKGSIALEIVKKYKDVDDLVNKGRLYLLEDEELVAVLKDNKKYLKSDMEGFSDIPFERFSSIFDKLGSARAESLYFYIDSMKPYIFENLIDNNTERFEEMLLSLSQPEMDIVIGGISKASFLYLMPMLVKNRIDFSTKVEGECFFIKDDSFDLADYIWLFEKSYNSSPKETLETLLEAKLNFIEDILAVYKERIETDQIFIKELFKYTHIIDISKHKGSIFENPKEVTRNQVESFPIQTTINLLLFPEISDEVFNYLLAQKQDPSDYEDISHQSGERQEIFFKRFNAYHKRFSRIHLCDKISDDFLMELFADWENDPEYNIRPNSRQIKVIFSKREPKSFSQPTLKALLLKMDFQDNLDIKKELMSYVVTSSGSILDQLGDSNVILSDLIQEGLLSKQDFRDNIENFKIFNSFMARGLILSSDYYYNLLTNDEKAILLSKILSGDGSDGLIKNPDRFIEMMKLSPSNVLNSIHYSELYLVLKEKNFSLANYEINSLKNVPDEALDYVLEFLSEDQIKGLVANDRFGSISPDLFNVIFPIFKKLFESEDEAILDNHTFIKRIIRYKEASELIIDYIAKNPKSDMIDQFSESELNINLFGKERFITYIKNLDKLEDAPYAQSKIVVKSLASGALSLEEIADLLENPTGLIEHFNKYLANHKQSERKFIRLLRDREKSHLLNKDYIVSFDLVKPDQEWSFYNNEEADSIMDEMTPKQKKRYVSNLKKALRETTVSMANYKVIAKVPFSVEELELIFSKIPNVRKFINYILIEGPSYDDVSVNKENLIEVLKNNQQILERMINEDGIEEALISLHKEGVSNIFSMKWASLDLTDRDMIEYLNESQDPHLLAMYKEGWKVLSTANRSYSPEIIKKLVKSVNDSDITLKNMTYSQSTVFLFVEETGVLLVQAKFNKKDGKWILIDGYRKDLFDKTIKVYESFHSKNPEKVNGKIDIETGDFIVSNDEYDHIVAKVSNEDSEQLDLIREMGVSGFVKATAKRMINLSYKLEIQFETETKNQELRKIEKMITDKTFDIDKKLKELLDVDAERTFGFELELSCPDSNREQIAKFLRKNGHKIDTFTSYKKSEGGVWEFKEDGSISEPESFYNEDTDEYEEIGDSFEIASPILKGKKGIKEAEKFLKRLFSHFDIHSGQEYNAGLHVHHDISRLLKIADDEKDIIKAYMPFQETLYKLVEDWRSESNYCMKIDPSVLRDRSDGNKTGIILTSYGTMEFRMKEGLVSAIEIINWIKYTQGIVDAVELKVKEDVKKSRNQIKKVSEMSFVMLADFMNVRSGNRMNQKARVKEIRKLIALQETLYAN